VASFRSAVTTLNTYLPAPRASSPLAHSDFAEAVISEFGSIYGAGSRGTIDVTTVEEAETKTGKTAGYEKIWKGVDELKSWDWTYGQTPEFENRIEGELSFGKIVGSRSR
jgi:lipoate-protein ligase A